MNFNLFNNTIFLVLSGSHAYGIATPTSDFDYKGIAIAPLSNYIGFQDKFEQCVDTENKNVYKNFPIGFLKDDPRVLGANPDLSPDIQILELSKFIRLAIQNNPSILEVIFSEEIIIKNPIINKLIENRDKLLCKSAKSRFSGYALSQLNRIKHHKRFLDNPPTHKPIREEYNLPEAYLINKDQMGAFDSLIKREIEDFFSDKHFFYNEDIKIEAENAMGRMLEKIWNSINPNKEYPIGYKKQFLNYEEALSKSIAEQKFSENFLFILNKEKQYQNAKKEWDSYQEWVKNRNPKRAELEKKYGFDLKHACHLKRLLTMAREIIETGKVNVSRKNIDAEELIAIRNGDWSYEKIVEFAENQNKELDELVKISKLPKVPDVSFFDTLTQNMILEMHEQTKTSR